MVVANNKSMRTNNTCETLAISNTIQMWWCTAGCIAQWSTSRASLEATVCRHWASACASLPRRPPWLTNLLKYTKHLQNTTLISNYCTFYSQTQCNFWDPKQTFYSAHQDNKLRENVRQHDLSWRASQTFLSIKHCQQTKIQKVISLEWSSSKTLVHICANSG